MSDLTFSPSLDLLACRSGYKFEWAVFPYPGIISRSNLEGSGSKCAPDVLWSSLNSQQSVAIRRGLIAYCTDYL